MKTQIELAREGVVTAQMAAVAESEGVTPEYVREKTAQGRIVIPWNHVRKPRAVGIGCVRSCSAISSSCGRCSR